VLIPVILPFPYNNIGIKLLLGYCPDRS
jgi:hypothetical protein